MSEELSTDLLFLDTETTGLGLEHDIWEIAYAIGEGPISSLVVNHSLRNADPKALEMNGYRERGYVDFIDSEWDEQNLKKWFSGKTIVGANPAFDAYRLAQRWGQAPWHYRLVDVEAMAVPIFGLVKPLGLRGLVEKINASGFDVPLNDHSAAGDVATVREVYKALMSGAFS